MQDFWRELCEGLGVLAILGAGSVACIALGYWLGSH
jgi:hypothetical protein